MSFLKKLFGFGGGKQDGVIGLIDDTLHELSEKAGLNFSYEIYEKEDSIHVDLNGEENKMIKAKDGQLLDGIQFFVKRVVQHKFKENVPNIVFDCDGFREDADKALVELAEKLKGIAIEKNRSVYFRALPPRDRRVIHQHLAQDERVISKSIGDGLYKKIKVFPAKGKRKNNQNNNNQKSAN
ncbi:MAG: R3H domain-containing nucleic acid-binding protein [Bdellovibrionota bacterium]|nr:hypothetical protein [Pseudobdellovibrionaceae bacterium]|tara:strand:- start:33310 stop:33855 length:546 start_codon:yes stop_codon:yes gene_type:complete